MTWGTAIPIILLVVESIRTSIRLGKVNRRIERLERDIVALIEADRRRRGA